MSVATPHRREADRWVSRAGVGPGMGRGSGPTPAVPTARPRIARPRIARPGTAPSAATSPDRRPAGVASRRWPVTPAGPSARSRSVGRQAPLSVIERSVLEMSPANPTTRRIVRDHAARTRCSSSRPHADRPHRRGRDQPAHPRVPRANRAAHDRARRPAGTPRPRRAPPPGAARAVGTPRPTTPARARPPEEPQHAPPARRAQRRLRHDRLPDRSPLPGSNGR